MKPSRTATLLAAYYVVIAAVLLVRIATRVGPQVMERLGPSGELVLEWLLWIALLALPLGLLLRDRGDAADHPRGPTAAERLRHLRPLALLVAYEIAVVLLLGSRILGLGAQLGIPEIAFWLFLLFLPTVVPYVDALSLSLPGPGGGKVNVELKRLQQRIEEEKQRIDRVTYDAERVIHSLTSLLFTPEQRVRDDVEKRLRERGTVIIGCADFTEQRLLCAIIAELLRRRTHFQQVIAEFDLGGASRNFVALARGATDVLPVYTWTGFELLYPTLLAERDQRSGWLRMDAEAQVGHLNQVFAEHPYPLTWATLLGFRNDWAMVMRADEAVRMEIEEVSDLRRWSGRLKLGCEADFYNRRNGLGILQDPRPGGYGVTFDDVCIYDHRDVYHALRDGEVDLVDGFTTDPDLTAGDLRVLEDDEARFGSYHAAIVVGAEFLEACEAECPDILDVLGLLRFRPGELEDGETPQERWARELGEMIREADRSRGGHFEAIRREAAGFLDRRGILHQQRHAPERGVAAAPPAHA